MELKKRKPFAYEKNLNHAWGRIEELKAINAEMLIALKAIESFDDGNFFDDLVNQGVHPDAVNKLADCIRATIAKAGGKE